MTKKTTFFVCLVLFAYILVAPVYVSVEYGDTERAQLPNSAAYTYLWLGSQSKTYYLAIFGVSRTEVTAITRIVIRDEGENLETVEITRAIAIIDGKETLPPTVEGITLHLDQSVSNGHAGYGGKSIAKFALQHPPKERLEIRVTGTATSADGDSYPFNITVGARILKKSFVLPFYKFVGNRLMST